VKDFKDSAKAEFEAATRRAIRKASKRPSSGKRGFFISPYEAETLMKIVNLQLYHLGKPIHPGYHAIARAINRSEGMVTKHMRRFESLGFIYDVRHRAGGWLDDCEEGKKATRKAIEFRVDIECLREMIDPMPKFLDRELVLLAKCSKKRSVSPMENGFTVDTQNEYTMHTKNGFTSYAPCNTSLLPVSLLSSQDDGEVSEHTAKDEYSSLDVTELDQPVSGADVDDSHLQDGCDPDAWRALTMDDAMPKEVIPLAGGSSVRRPRGRLVYLDAWRGAGELGSHRFAGQAA
jgi:hypothetical protein